MPVHAIDPPFLNRRLPRSFSGEEIPGAVLEQGFEAARRAPSALIAVLSWTSCDDGTPILTQSFDTSAAWANVAHPGAPLRRRHRATARVSPTRSNHGRNQQETDR